jgi:hypothetical protein
MQEEDFKDSNNGLCEVLTGSYKKSPISAYRDR